MRSEFGSGFFGDAHHNRFVQTVHSRVVELRGDGAENRNIVVGSVPELVVALVLFFHVADSIEGAALVEFVQSNDVGEIQHIDLFQLRGRTVFRRHHVQAGIGMLDNFGVTLANAGRFQDDQVEVGGFYDVYGVLHVFAQSQVALSGGQGTHINPLVRNGIHPDTV